MPRTIRFLLLLICFSVKVTAASVVFKPDTLTSILKLEDQSIRERKLTAFLNLYFVNSPLTALPVEKNEIDKLLSKYDADHKAEIDYFIESIDQTRQNHLNAAENALIKAIELAGKKSDHFLLYTFFSHLAFIQTFNGGAIQAISSFRTAKNEAIKLDDANLQVVIDINISDLYFRNSFYDQSLFYLNQALGLISTNQFKGNTLRRQQLRNIMYVNIAENYFRMDKLDSLKKYNAILNKVNTGELQLYTFKKRTDYYVDILNGRYNNAVKSILFLKNDSKFQYDNGDEQNLADAYFHAGNADSAKSTVNRLLSGLSDDNHPETKFRLYKLMGNIAEYTHDDKQANYYLKSALLQLENHLNRLARFGDISASIKIDEIQNSYMQREEAYKRERLWYIFAIIVSLLVITIVFMFYRNNHQKRKYERLLIVAQKEELAFINSHEVRRHLSNILGIIETIKHADDKYGEFSQMEGHLLFSANSLDAAIVNISEKLDNLHK